MFGCASQDQKNYFYPICKIGIIESKHGRGTVTTRLCLCVGAAPWALTRASSSNSRVFFLALSTTMSSCSLFLWFSSSWRRLRSHSSCLCLSSSRLAACTFKFNIWNFRYSHSDVQVEHWYKRGLLWALHTLIAQCLQGCLAQQRWRDRKSLCSPVFQDPVCWLTSCFILELGELSRIHSNPFPTSNIRLSAALQRTAKCFCAELIVVWQWEKKGDFWLNQCVFHLTN